MTGPNERPWVPVPDSMPDDVVDVWCAVMRANRDDGVEIKVTDAALAKSMGRSVATVQKRLRKLEALGYIRREKTDEPGVRLIRLMIRLWPPPE